MIITINKKADKSQNLLTFLFSEKHSVEACCGGNLTCGKCKVKVLKGNFIYSEKEILLLSDNEIKNNIILACHHNIGDIKEVLILEKSDLMYIEDIKISKYKNNKYKIVHIENLDNLISLGVSFSDAINMKLEKKYIFSLKSLQNLSNIENYNSFYILLKNNKYVLDCSQKNIFNLYGIAVDIGGTTIAISLINLLNGSILDKNSFINPQKSFGGDVISRINRYVQDKNTLLYDVLISSIKESILSIIAKNNLDYNYFSDIVISGNTTMLSFFTRLNPHNLAISPFNATNLSKKEFLYHEIFYTNELKATITILPSISSYVGADITSGLYHTDILKNNKNILFIDIGTNGEIALKTQENKIYCTATAAGPAFEGANIKNGIGSVPGAISNLKIVNNKAFYDTIMNEKPIGICGSGIISSIAQLLKNNLVDYSGKMTKKPYFPILNKKIGIYQEDIRAFQLAKSAIATGIEILLKVSNLKCHDIDEIILAGGFGSNINLEDSITVGLIPNFHISKIKILGNTSLGGAIKYLTDSKSDTKINKIIKSSVQIDLASSEFFNDSYVNNLFLRSCNYD